jgi:L-ribulokinase
MKNAGEGGAWGVALLALYAVDNKGTLEEFLDGMFASCEKETTEASSEEKSKFASFMKEYKKGLAVEALATKNL